MVELRTSIRKAVTPFLRGGWRHDEKESDLYSVYKEETSNGGKGTILPNDGIVDITTGTSIVLNNVPTYHLTLLWYKRTIGRLLDYK